MKSHSLLPHELMQFTMEHHLSSMSNGFHGVYLILVLSLVTGIALLPSVFVMVTIKSPGILRPASELSLLKATAAGTVKEVKVKENDEVKKGQLLFAIHSSMLEEKESFLTGKLKEVYREMEDLHRLILLNKSNTLPAIDMITPLYRQSFIDYEQKMTDRKFRLAKVSHDYDRNKKLYDEQVIARAEFENYEFELNKARTDLAMVKHSQLNDWQKELTSHEKEADNYRDQLIQTQRESENLNVFAPVSGSIQNLAGIYPGSQVIPNQDLGQISPNAALQGEVYASPNDIGLLREGMDARIRVLSFDYNQWGFATGKIKEISKDIQFRNNEPVYEIKCSLDHDFLTLKNGHRGKLKKGMTLLARFSVAERSLWQLLYDKVDDWINPGVQQ